MKTHGEGSTRMLPLPWERGVVGGERERERELPEGLCRNAWHVSRGVVCVLRVGRKEVRMRGATPAPMLVRQAANTWRPAEGL